MNMCLWVQIYLLSFEDNSRKSELLPISEYFYFYDIVLDKWFKRAYERFKKLFYIYYDSIKNLDFSMCSFEFRVSLKCSLGI